MQHGSIFDVAACQKEWKRTGTAARRAIDAAIIEAQKDSPVGMRSGCMSLACNLHQLFGVSVQTIAWRDYQLA